MKLGPADPTLADASIQTDAERPAMAESDVLALSLAMDGLQPSDAVHRSILQRIRQAVGRDHAPDAKGAPPGD